MRKKTNLFFRKLSQIFFIVLIMQVVVSGCSEKFVADTDYNIDEELDIPKVLFVFDDSKMSKDAKPLMASLREKYQNQVKFYFIDSKTDEARPVLETYGLVESNDYPYIRIDDASGRSSRNVHGFNPITKENMEGYILQAIKGSTIPEGFDGEWEVVSNESKSNGLYGMAYEIIINTGDKIRFIDGRIVQFGAFPMEYELTDDNEIILMRGNTASIVFNYEISGNTLSLENDYAILEASKTESP